MESIMQKKLVFGIAWILLLFGALNAEEDFSVSPNKRILLHIQEELRSHYHNYSINLRIYDGTVTLTGVVDSDADREDMVRRIRGINGVKQVNSQLELRLKDDAKETADSPQAPS